MIVPYANTQTLLHGPTKIIIFFVKGSGEIQYSNNWAKMVYSGGDDDDDDDGGGDGGGGDNLNL